MLYPLAMNSGLCVNKTKTITGLIPGMQASNLNALYSRILTFPSAFFMSVTRVLSVTDNTVCH